MLATGGKRIPTLFWAALLIWSICCALVVTHYVLNPHKHDSLDPSIVATRHWWAREDMYSSPNNSGSAFFYFPQSAIIFTPVIWGTPPTGTAILRVFNFILFGWGVWRTSRLLLESSLGKSENFFLWVSLLAIPASLASLRNGQFDLPLAAVVLLATADVAAERWWWAVFWLCLGVTFKPLAMVPLLLFGALYLPLWFRLVVGLVFVAIMPWLCAPWGYVNWQYYRLFQTFGWAYHLHEERFSDFASLLESAGIRPPEPWMTLIRLSASLLCLGLGWVARRTLSAPIAAWFIGSMAAEFLVLFNPRSEACSFVFLSPFVAALAVFYLLRPLDKMQYGRWIGWCLAIDAFLLASDGIPGEFGSISLLHIWLKPLAATWAFLALIAFLVKAGEGKPISFSFSTLFTPPICEEKAAVEDPITP